jgi:ribonuclease PH
MLKKGCWSGCSTAVGSTGTYDIDSRWQDLTDSLAGAACSNDFIAIQLEFIPLRNEIMRAADQLRDVVIQRGYLETNPASVLYRSGRTIVLCTASIEPTVPPWLAGKGKGWVTAEYNMLPGSTSPRKQRERGGKIDGRTTEIQRLIGRSLRSIIDLQQLGEQMITVDCDVLQADGGTRTASITGGFIALAEAVRQILPGSSIGNGPLVDSVAAVSVGLIGNEIRLDLDYDLDVAADVDMNVVMTGKGRFVEIQGTGEEATFDDSQLTQMLSLARKGIAELTQKQREV